MLLDTNLVCYHNYAMKRKQTYQSLLIPVRREVVSAAEYLRITRESPHLIERSRFLSPFVGESDFGAFELQYRIPVLRKRLEAA